MWQRAKIIDPTNGDMRPLWFSGMLIWVKVGRPRMVRNAVDFYTREELGPHEVFITNLLDNDNKFSNDVVVRSKNCELLGEFAKDDDVEFISLQCLEELARQLI